MCLWSPGFVEVLIPLWSLGLFSYPEIAPVMSLTHSFYSRGAWIQVATVLGSVIMVYRENTKVLEFVQDINSLWFLHPTLRCSSSSMFWEFISNCTQFFRGGGGDEAFQPILSSFSFESAMSLFKNVQFPLNVKETTFLVFYLVLL